MGTQPLIAEEVQEHISSVPDKEFERPKTIDELKETARLASGILYAVCMRVVQDDAAWRIVHQVHLEAVDAYIWICAVKWIGEPEWKKQIAGAA